MFSTCFLFVFVSFSTVLRVNLLADIESVELNRNRDAPLFRRQKVDAMSELTRLHKMDVGDVVGYRCFMGQV